MTKRSLTLHKVLKESVLNDEEAYAEYKAFKLQLELADKMRKTREKLPLTQSELAKKLNINKSVIARLEAGGGKGRHSPSLKTLVRYAHAMGYQLDIKLKRITESRIIP
jgi:DNA-binding XRE family transcriptional regulator